MTLPEYLQHEVNAQAVAMLHRERDELRAQLAAVTAERDALLEAAMQIADDVCDLGNYYALGYEQVAALRAAIARVEGK